MPSAAALRFQIETALQARIPGALTPRPRIVRELAACGIPELDALLGGGLPIGAISELVGPQGSGRTTLALAALAEMTEAGKSVAWIDTTDALDPESAAAAGVDLDRQLWVRCGHSAPARSTSGVLPRGSEPNRGAALLVEGSRTAAPSGGCGSPHPRGEARGLSEAVDAFLQPDVFSRPAPPRDPAMPRRNRVIGTPSAPNRKLVDRVPFDPRPFPRRAQDREEQVATDRLPTRRQMLHSQGHTGAAEAGADGGSKGLQAAQIANTAQAAAARETPRGGTWTDNRNNAAGRCFATPPNAVAAGLPRFRERGARTSGQDHDIAHGSPAWQPSLQDLRHKLAPAAAPQQAASHAHTGSTKASEASKGSEASRATGGHKRAARSGPHASLLGERPTNLHRSSSPLWQALDQALRATDLLLAAGGFSAIVVDLGSIPAEFAWRIPLATWFRFRAAADRARTVLLLLTQHPCARSSAELVLRLQPAEPEAAATVLTGAQFRIAVDRHRFETNTHIVSSSPLVAVSAPGAAGHAPTGGLHLVSSRKPPHRAGADGPLGARGTAWGRSMAWARTGTGSGPGLHRNVLPSSLSC